MADNKGKFQEWLATRMKEEGGRYSPGTQGDYMGAIRRSHKRFRNEYGNHESLFDITDLGEFDRVFQKIKDNTEEYAAFNGKGKENGRFSAVMKLYRAFLSGEGAIPPNYKGDGDKKTKKKKGEDGKGGTKPGAGKSVEPRNLVFFGAPGTGKSYLLNKKSKALLGDDGESIRVTFHPDYSYAHFVGTYKPVPEGSEITYKYVPGPFMETYVKAVENPNNRYMLIIEEINRANVAAVFGDVFQLLDRTETGESEYPVKASKDIRDYLGKDVDDNKKRKWNPADCKEIKIPENMYIWATMNSADQGVFPMDTAFKRRWEFEYLPITTGEDAEIIRDAMVPMGNNNEMKKWNDVRKDINDLLARLGINEDKQLGAFFINADIIANAATEAGEKRFKDTFKDKVLMYLFEDAAKHKRKEVFGANKDNGNKRYSEIREAFDKTGMGVFEGLKKKTDNGRTQQEGTGGTAGTPTLEGNVGEQEP